MLPEFNKKELPSLITDPFLKDKIKGIWIYGTSDFNNGKLLWYAWVEFTNGRTQGKQTTQKYEDFNDVLAELKTIFEIIKQK